MSGGRLRSIAAHGLAALLVILLAACGRPAQVQQEAYVFGTRVELIVAGEPEDKARRAMADVLAEFDRLHRTYHAWQPSALTDLNAAIGRGEAATVSPELAAMLTDAQRISAAGDGLFDPGIGKLISIWGFQADEFAARLPDAAALAAWSNSRPGIADLTIAGDKVTSRNRDVAIDLGGYAKGYALDRAAAILRGQGIGNALVNIGGNVLALGSKNGEPWRVGIQHPRRPGPLAAVTLADGEAIGTSGDYQRYFEVGGKRYCHLLDPRSGRPAEGTQAVTVLIPPAPDAGSRSDALSKPLFIAGGDWPRLARKLGVAAALRIDSSGRIEATAALARRLEFAGEKPPVSVVP